jgi:diguanylate cyclase (GGDEF)-like protein
MTAPPPRLRLLLIEDSLSDAALVTAMVRRQGFDLVYERVDTAVGLLAALDRDEWDVVIADHGMPSFGARAALDLIRGQNRDLPVIVVTGTILDEEAVDYMKHGASDYLLKDRLSRLGDAVRRALGERSLRARQRRAEDELRHQALHDSLTGLPNRLLLNEHLESILRSAAHSGQPVSLLLLDLDRFNEVNDTLGHPIGDLVLRQVATRLQSAIGATETLARLGGDEFGIILPAADPETARELAHLVLMEFDRHFSVRQHQLGLAASIGIAIYPQHGDDAQTLLQHADVAMYVAKRGHLGMAVYDATQDRHTLRRLELVHDLRKAVRDGDLLPYFQPKVALAAGQFCGVELLLRWPHRVHGFIPPDEFIPLAEQTGLVLPLTEWVLLSALAQAQAWREKGHGVPIAINLSTRSLQDPHFPDLLVGHLRRYEADPKDLTLEITESMLMADPRRAREVLVNLHALGLRIAIDDFGTGYSSLGYLKELPVDEVKIDKSFVIGMATGDRKDLAIVRSIIAMAHALDLVVVAEGVEDAASYGVLRELGTDIAQGYFLSRPCPAADFEQWLESYGPKSMPGLEGNSPI